MIGGSQVYGPVRSAAAIQLSSIKLTLPTATGFSGPGASSGVLPTSRRCLSRRRFEIRVKRGRGKARLRSAKVWVNGKRVKVRRRAGRLRAVVDLRGQRKQRVKVRIVARTRERQGPARQARLPDLHEEAQARQEGLAAEQVAHEALQPLERPALDRAEHDRAVCAAFRDELEARHAYILIGVSHGDLKITYQS